MCLTTLMVVFKFALGLITCLLRQPSPNPAKKGRETLSWIHHLQRSHLYLSRPRLPAAVLYFALGLLLRLLQRPSPNPAKKGRETLSWISVKSRIHIYRGPDFSGPRFFWLGRLVKFEQLRTQRRRGEKPFLGQILYLVLSRHSPRLDSCWAFWELNPAKKRRESFLSQILFYLNHGRPC